MRFVAHQHEPFLFVYGNVIATVNTSRHITSFSPAFDEEYLNQEAIHLSGVIDMDDQALSSISMEIAPATEVNVNKIN